MTPTTATATVTALPNTAPPPPVLRSLQETGLGMDQIEMLLIKTLYGGEATGLALAERMRLPFTMLEPLIERVRAGAWNPDRIKKILGGNFLRVLAALRG